jgi:hypothetical protein
MRKIKYSQLLILFLLPEMLPAQFVLKKALNAPRPGDELTKQQVEYKDPGRSGENVL